MAHSLLADGVVGAAAQLAVDRDTVSPAWSIYDDCVYGASQDDDVLDSRAGSAEEEEEGGVDGGWARAVPRRLPFISDPLFCMTLKGSQLKKDAPIRRGAQGAVYSAFDEAIGVPASGNRADESALQGTCPGCKEKDHVAGGAPRLARCGRRVAVKRIFIQASDFSARDISTTILREVTLHRFVCARQSARLVETCASHAAALASGVTQPVQVDPHQAPSDLIDDTARVIHLYRVVEAPHKGLCLVMELAATNLEQIVLAHGSRSALKSEGVGGYRRKPGIVSLFGSSSVAGVGCGRGLASGLPPRDFSEAVTSERMALSPSSSPSARMPLVRYVMRRLLRLVCFLHETCGVVHRDLKLSNVLVTRDAGLRLGDFGSARFFPPPRRAAKAATESSQPLENLHEPAVSEPALFPCTPLSIRTTLHYRSPEVLLGDQECRAAADIWALGVMFAQLLLQRRLFNSTSELDLLGAIQKLLGPLRYHSKPSSQSAASSTADPAGGVAPAAPFSAPQASLPYKFHAGVVPADGLDLLSRMLQQQPESRITARGALQHPFLNLEGPPESTTHDDDERGRAQWEERVAEVLREQAEGGTYAVAGSRRPVFMHLTEDEESEEEDGVAPFCVHPCGYTSS